MGYKSHAQRKAVHASKAEKKGASMKKYGASKKKFPEIKEKNEGKFTKWVEKNMPGTDTMLITLVAKLKKKELQWITVKKELALILS